MISVGYYIYICGWIENGRNYTLNGIELGLILWYERDKVLCSKIQLTTRIVTRTMHIVYFILWINKNWQFYPVFAIKYPKGLKRATSIRMIPYFSLPMGFWTQSSSGIDDVIANIIICISYHRIPIPFPILYKMWSFWGKGLKELYHLKMPIQSKHVHTFKIFFTKLSTAPLFLFQNLF